VRTAFSVVILLTLFTTTGAHASGSSALAGKTWALQSLSGRHPEPKGATAEFTAGGKVSGFAGCNSFSGTYTASGSSISISKNLAMTQMACASSVMAAETAYIDALTSARRYSTSGSTLKLKTRLGRALATFGVQSQSLAGTKWLVISYNNGKGAVTSVTSGTKLTASFTAADVSGFAGCNDYSASAKTTPPKITVGPVSATRKACSTPSGVMEQEQAYLAALATAATYRLEGNQLELRTAADAIAVTMQRAG
jgi:heat shock protein HslJ